MAFSIPRPLRTVLPVLLIIIIGGIFLLQSAEDLSPASLAHTNGHIDAGGYDPHAAKEYNELDEMELKKNLVEDEHRQHPAPLAVPPLELKEDELGDDVLYGNVIMEKLGNETAK